MISLAHLHAPAVSVREQAALVVDRLRRAGTLTFRALTGDAPDLVTTVARFLALLELFRERAVAFEQLTPLGELTIRWTGSDAGELDISDEFDGAGRPAADESRPDRVRPAATADGRGRWPSDAAGRRSRRRWRRCCCWPTSRSARPSWPRRSACRPSTVDDCLAELVAFYDETGRGFELRGSAAAGATTPARSTPT